MVKYVALLRGINVGGNNVIKMPALKACFEKHGFEHVSTYIASGNVLFESPETDATELCAKIEKMLSETFGYEAVVVLRNRRQMKSVVERAPDGFGEQPAKYRYDVAFLKDPLTPKVAMKSVSLKEGVDEAYTGPGVL